LIEVILIGAATALATGLGAVPVFFLGGRAAGWEPALWGFAAGVMGVAAVVGLAMPAFEEGGSGTVLAGLAAGIAFLLGSRALLARHEVTVAGRSGASVTTSVLVFAVLLVHSVPEGFAIGTAYASEDAALGLFVIGAIALQNVPEGTSVAIPMAEAGFSRSRQFWAGVLTSLPQPVGAGIAYAAVETVESLLPLSFAFAAGAMAALVLTDLLPPAMRKPIAGGAGAALGAAGMLAFSLVLGV
jgi:ZIP family zinc transporter